jgi:hypothetical protein
LGSLSFCRSVSNWFKSSTLSLEKNSSISFSSSAACLQNRKLQLAGITSSCWHGLWKVRRTVFKDTWYRRWIETSFLEFWIFFLSPWILIWKIKWKMFFLILKNKLAICFSIPWLSVKKSWGQKCLEHLTDRLEGF